MVWGSVAQSGRRGTFVAAMCCACKELWCAVHARSCGLLCMQTCGVLCMRGAVVCCACEELWCATTRQTTATPRMDACMYARPQPDTCSPSMRRVRGSQALHAKGA
eukprot:366126-Chlamydomonas_euryale.AAC.3